MKVALVCDWLTTPGGAEKLLLALHRLYPDAPIYTSKYSSKRIDWFKDAKVKTGWLQLFPACLRKFLGPLRQLYFSHLDLSHYDLVISVTGAEAKSIRTVEKSPKLSKLSTTKKPNSTDVEIIPKAPHRARHICYCHVPTQYYWQMYDEYLKNPGFGFLNPLVRLALKLFVKPLRRADYAAAQQPDEFVTISHYAAKQIKTYYDRDATIIAPPVETDLFAPKSFSEPTSGPKKPFIIHCRQVTWKRIDLAISACLEAQEPLVVIGDGPEHQKLVKLAAGSPLITFLPWLNTPEIASNLQKSRAYLFPSLEPFGIAAVEALAAGCPVIAFAEGGSTDIVQPGKNGLLFSNQTAPSLADAIRRFSPEKFDQEFIVESAAKFSVPAFRQNFLTFVSKNLPQAQDNSSGAAPKPAQKPQVPPKKPLNSPKPKDRES